MPATKRVTAGWWKLCFRIWLVLCIGVHAIYLLGGDGYRFSQTGTSNSFNRADDWALLRVDDSLAFHVRLADSTGSVYLVRYREGSLPFSPLLGRYEAAGEKMLGITHQRGDWVYRDSPEFGPESAIDIYNLRTGEEVRVGGFGQVAPSTSTSPDLRTLPDYASRGLLGGPEDKIASPATLAKRYPPLDTVRESQVTYVGGFLLAGMLLLLLWPLARRNVASTQQSATA